MNQIKRLPIKGIEVRLDSWKKAVSTALISVAHLISISLMFIFGLEFAKEAEANRKKVSTPLSTSVNLKLGVESSGGGGSPFVRPSTANLGRHRPI